MVNTAIVRVDELFSEAFACVEQALCYEEMGNNPREAMELYERGLNLIEDAIKDKKIAKKSDMYSGMMETKKTVTDRLKTMKKAHNSKKPGEDRDKKEGEKIPHKTGEGTSDAHNDHQVGGQWRAGWAGLKKEQIRQQLDSLAGPTTAELIFLIPGGVQLFIIKGDETSVPTYPSPLEICRFTDGPSSADGAEAFIQVGPWIYPLIRGKTPVLRNDIGAYIFANPTPEHPEMCVGLVLPSDLDASSRQAFHDVLENLSLIMEKEVRSSLSREENERLSAKIATLILKSSEMLAWSVKEAQQRATCMVTTQQSRYRAELVPDAEPMNISPALRNSVHYIHSGSKVLAKCTRYLLDRIGDMGVALGRQLAASAERRMGDGSGGRVVSDAITVIGGSVTGISTVWMALEDASKALCRSIANEAVTTVQHKYGEQASRTTHDALFAAGHSSLAAFQIWDFGPRAIAGRVAKRTGIQFVRDLHAKKITKTDSTEKRPL